MNSWKDWNPGLDNDGITLGEMVSGLPGNNPEQINDIVKIFENPESPLAFPGAISLPRHDCVHIVLGRGLLAQDEAFVIGFTMGTSKELSALEGWLFSLITKYLYPHPYKFNDKHLKVLKLGIETGKDSPCTQIYKFPFEEMMDEKLGEIRKMLGIDKNSLKDAYRMEKALIPDSKESLRLSI
jgi:hypothetical protein